MAQPWFRFYSETLNDRKIAHLVRVTQQPKALVIGVWATILALANDSPIRGVLLLTEDIPLTFNDLARETGLDADSMQTFILELERLNMMSMEDGAYCLINWDKRQFASDNVTERVRRWRARQKQDEDSDGNGDGGESGNDSEPEDETLQQRYGNGPDTDGTEADDRGDANASVAESPPKQPLTGKNKLKLDLADCFSTHSGIKQPSGRGSVREKQKRWWTPLINIAELCDLEYVRTAKLVEWAIDTALQQGLSIKTPQSIEAIAISEQQRRIKGLSSNGNRSNVSRGLDAIDAWLEETSGDP